MHKFIKSIWLPWTLVSCAGSIVGFTLGRGYGLWKLSLVGLMMGLGQWLILRSRLTAIWGWIPATILGLPLGFLVSFLISDVISSIFANEPVRVFIMSGTAGLITSIIQWLALQRKMRNALRWLVASALSWGTGITITGYIVEGYLSSIELGQLFSPIIGLFIGAFVGIISGVFIESSILPTDQKGTDSYVNAS